VAPATFLLANRADRAQIPPNRIALSEVVPHAQFTRGSPQDFLTRTAEPIQQRVIGENIFFVAPSKNADENRARLESRAEPRFTFGQRVLTPFTLDAERERIGHRAEGF